MKLFVANIIKQTYALGPGLRAVIWVQGCPFRCAGCIAPSWQVFKGGKQFDPEEVVRELVTESVHGLTFSGGEPFSQAEALAEVAYLARKKKPGLDIICFTGYRHKVLLQHPTNVGTPRLLSLLDVLIDGPYVRTLNDGIGLRGSSNQRIIHLTDRMKGFTLEYGNRQMEMIIEEENLTFVGIPSPNINKALSPFMETEGAHHERI